MPSLPPQDVQVLMSLFPRGKVLGVGRFCVVIQDLEHTDTVIKCTSESIAFEFLQHLHYSNHTMPAALLRVLQIIGEVHSERLSAKYMAARVEKLYELDSSCRVPTLLHKAWVGTVSKDKLATGIDLKRLRSLNPDADLVKSIQFINEFTSQRGGCFDGDTFSNCLARHDGALVLADPVTQVS